MMTTTDLATARHWFDQDGAIVNVYPDGSAALSTTGPDVWADSYQREE
jgi:hypothetical protein